MSYKFQVNLGSIIELLSAHLYSGPQVYLRELLQNGLDAIEARKQLTPSLEGKIDVHLRNEEEHPTLVFQDNGIGLTEEELHSFLATIGQTSKNSDIIAQRGDFLGQFGIGLLACFLVSDEIVIFTRSARQPENAFEWRGRPDGTYKISPLPEGLELEIGTQLHLRCKQGAETYFRPERVEELLYHFGSLLPEQIWLSVEDECWQINEEPAPWRVQYESKEEQKDVWLEYGKEELETEFFDCIPIQTPNGDVEGLAYILPYSPSPSSRRTHRIYLKNMMLTEHAEHLLPDWAFFVRCVLNVERLQPTASREGFFENEALFEAQEQIGQCLRDYLLQLAEESPQRMQKLIYLHDLSLKALALQDNEFYQEFIEWFPFETTLGNMTLEDYRADYPVIQYTVRLDQFRQIARIAAAQSMCVINGSYIYDADLLGRLPQIFPDTQLELVDAANLTQHFDDLSEDELEQAEEFLDIAEDALAAYECDVALKKFLPTDMPTMYTSNADANFQRSVEQTKEVADMLWTSVLDSLVPTSAPENKSLLCINYDNPLIQQLIDEEDDEALEISVQMLYVQALLLGHHPLSSQEMSLLNTGLLELIQRSLRKPQSLPTMSWSA